MNKWTKEACLHEASKHTTKAQWLRESASSFKIAYRNKWFDECTKHMISAVKSYTLDDCKSMAKQFNRRSEWAKGHAATYSKAFRNDWIELCCEHMCKPYSVYLPAVNTLSVG